MDEQKESYLSESTPADRSAKHLVLAILLTTLILIVQIVGGIFTGSLALISDKGASIGTVLAFMMAVVALSLQEMIILRRVLKPQLIAIFVAVVAVSIVLTGSMFNLVV